MDRPSAPTDVEVDIRALLGAVWRRLPQIIVFLIIVAAATYLGLGKIAPQYKSEATILIAPGESDLTRTAQSPADSTVLDEQAVTSQVQLIRSRDLAEAVATKLNLAARPEFDPNARPSLLARLMARLGLARNVTATTNADRVLTRYFSALSVYAIDKSRVINIDFTSTDPLLAADAANAVAEEYLARQSAAKRDSTASAADWLSSQVAELRQKVQDAEARVEVFRSKNGLFDTSSATTSGGATTLSQQQLSDLSTELSRVRADRATAEAKAAQIRAALSSNAIANNSDVLASPIIQNLVTQEITLRGQIAQLSATLLPNHPKMQELNAQLADLDQQISSEARRILASLESETKTAAAREAEINQALAGLKQQATVDNDASVGLRALEREAAADRDLLNTYLARYREAVGREQGDVPPDARIVSRAAVASTPNFPKKVPMTAAITVAVLILSIAFLLLRELASGRPVRRVRTASSSMPVVPGALPVSAHSRWADDHRVRRMMPAEPTLAPEVVDHVEESLRDIAHQIVAAGLKRVLVTLAEGSDTEGRPLGAVALARALARTDARVALVDFRGDGADAQSMGEGNDLPGFSDLFDGQASFAQVIFRDRKSRVHFIPAGRKQLTPRLLDADHLETILAALTLTYDYVLMDAADEMIPVVGPGSNVAMVVSEFGSADPRTARAFDRVNAVSDAPILLLVVDPAQAPAAPADAADEAAA
jgi:uncharacterized protein involved in exopolysaccharide biosynthesis/Mrp family chromosome partitioning ATPase